MTDVVEAVEHHHGLHLLQVAPLVEPLGPPLPIQVAAIPTHAPPLETVVSAAEAPIGLPQGSPGQKKKRKRPCVAHPLAIALDSTRAQLITSLLCDCLLNHHAVRSLRTTGRKNCQNTRV